MCGLIAYRASGQFESKVDLNSLIEEMSYRGLPGYKGYKKLGRFQMAHYSLPFVNLDPRVAIQPAPDKMELFVGEIFNYHELYDGIYHNDIEAIEQTFHISGLDDFHKFDGFWSFVAIQGDSLIGVTDHLGIKPLYYRTDMEIIASEIEVLRRVGPTTPNALFLSNTMKWGYDPTGNTPWNEIRQVPPGHYVKNGNVYPYWDWKKVKAESNLRDTLTKATYLRLGGQRKVAMLLSGGLDSTILYNIIKKTLKVNHVTVIHVDNGEDRYVQEALHDEDSLINVKLDEVDDVEAVAIHQSPVDLGSVKPQIAMARKLKQLGFNAVMTGDGADELFGGYRRAKEYDSQASDIFCELPYYHLPKLDRTMMRSTIELRAPFLAPSVIKHALNTPYDMRDGEKKVLKKIFQDLVPQNILSRDKVPLKTDAIRTDPMANRKRNMEIWEALYG